MKTLIPGMVWSVDVIMADSPVSHGSAAEAKILTYADAQQVALLWGSVPHWSSVVDFPATGSSADAIKIPIVVPPMVDRALVKIYASGDGNVYIGTLTIGIDSASTDQDGDTGTSIGHAAVFSHDTLLTVTASNAAATPHELSAYSDSGVRVYSMGLFWRRSTEVLTDAI